QHTPTPSEQTGGAQPPSSTHNGAAHSANTPKATAANTSTLRPDTPRRPGPTGLGGAEERGSSASFIAGAAGAADASGCAGVGEGGCKGEAISPPSDRRCRPSTPDEAVSTTDAGISP